MDYFKRNKLTTTVIIVLLALNIASICFILLSPIRRGFLSEKEPVEKIIERELNFSDLQKKQYAALREQLFRHGDSMMVIQATTMDELFRFVRLDTLNRDGIRLQALKLGSMETERSIGLVEHFHAVRALCDHEQQQKFDKIIVDVLNHIRDERRLPKPPNAQRKQEE